jgi:hypothetical protein
MGRFRLTLIATVIAASTVHATAAPSMRLLPSAGPTSDALVQLADTRSYHHCHNKPRHIRCHKGGRLP